MGLQWDVCGDIGGLRWEGAYSVDFWGDFCLRIGNTLRSKHEVFQMMNKSCLILRSSLQLLLFLKILISRVPWVSRFIALEGRRAMLPVSIFNIYMYTFSLWLCRIYCKVICGNNKMWRIDAIPSVFASKKLVAQSVWTFSVQRRS